MVRSLLMVKRGTVKRVILKLSGDLFSDDDERISFAAYDKVAKRIIKIADKTKVEIVIVVGGGNIFRGRQVEEMKVDRSEADTMGMLATIINGTGLREALVRRGREDTRLMTAVEMPEVGEPYLRVKARHHLRQGRIVIIGGGLGRPFFTTDSAVAQYATELKCDLVLKASTVDGVYEKDPKEHPEAKKYEELDFQEALVKDLKIMDATAFAMCREQELPVIVFNIKDLDKLPDMLNGKLKLGTKIK